MATVPKTSGNLIVYLIILVGLVGGYIYYSQMASSVVVPPVSQEGSETLRLLQNLKINYGMLDDASYKALTVFGELPVVPGLGGKIDPFAP